MMSGRILPIWKKLDPQKPVSNKPCRESNCKSLPLKVNCFSSQQRRSSLKLHNFRKDFPPGLDTGRLTMNFGLADLNACLSETYEIWLSRFEKKGVALYFSANPGLQSLIFDYAKVQHIFSNLLENSLKFTPPGRTAWLSAEPHPWERAALVGWRRSCPKEKFLPWEKVFPLQPSCIFPVRKFTSPLFPGIWLHPSENKDVAIPLPG